MVDETTFNIIGINNRIVPGSFTLGDVNISLDMKIDATTLIKNNTNTPNNTVL
jgi:hypothetical protein